MSKILTVGLGLMAMSSLVRANGLDEYTGILKGKTFEGVATFSNAPTKRYLKLFFEGGNPYEPRGIGKWEILKREGGRVKAYGDLTFTVAPTNIAISLINPPIFQSATQFRELNKPGGSTIRKPREGMKIIIDLKGEAGKMLKDIKTIKAFETGYSSSKNARKQTMATIVVPGLSYFTGIQKVTLRGGY